MPPSPTRLDPEGYYACLGVDPSATQPSIVRAFRAKARLLHPDVPATGNADAFLAVKQAYDVLSHPGRREAYDSKAQALAARPVLEPEVAAAVRRPGYRPYRPMPPAGSAPPANSASFAHGAPVERSRITGVSAGVWAGLAAFLCLCLYEAGNHILTPRPANNAGIRPNAQSVEPLSPAAHRAVLYGPAPVKLAGTPNFYVTPAGTPALIWRLDPARNALVAFGQLPPFTAVQAIRIVRQNGMLEILVNDKGNGFIGADHLTPGNATAARAAYCSFNAGPTPSDGEVLQRNGHGNSRLRIENHALQPAVVKLRDIGGAVTVAVFLSPGSHTDLDGLPEGTYRPEFAIGELWSRACNAFAAGMRARRMAAPVRLPNDAPIVITAGTEAASDISDQAFARE